MPLSSKVEVKAGGIHGNCWFAKEDIKEGEMIWKIREAGQPHCDLVMTIAEVNKMPEAARDKFMSLAYQIDDDHYLGVDETKIIQVELNEMYVNHSCDGNCWYENDELLVAMRDIKAGEELCYDYALTEGDSNWVIPKCLCGTKLCRGTVTGNDHLLPGLQAKYGNHFLSYVQKKIARAKQQAQHSKPARSHSQQQQQQQYEHKNEANGSEEDEPQEEAESDEDEKPKKKGKGKKSKSSHDDEPAAEPSRRSSRARKENKKVAAAIEEMSRNKRKGSDDEGSGDDEPPKKKNKRGKKKPSDDDDYDDGDF
jgi:flagellar biosynthesis GTPase FlhF